MVKVGAAAALPVAVAVALAAVQLLPTLGRLADSPRSGGLPTAQATTWSAPPGRLVELVFPRFYGDPSRDQENLYFGWHRNDRDYPYVLSIYPGLLLAVLGLAALLRWRVPRRAGWAAELYPGALQKLLDPAFRQELDVTQDAVSDAEGRIEEVEDVLLSLVAGREVAA